MFKIVNLIGTLECILGVCIALGGSISSLGLYSECIGDTAGVGAACGMIGLAGSIFIGAMLFFGGRGLLKRSQLARRLHIAIAAILSWQIFFAFSRYCHDLIESIAVPIVAIMFLVLMFLPSVKAQFAKDESTEME